jgi:acyl carrier protein
MFTQYLPGVSAAIRAAARGPIPSHLNEAQSFVLDLGFDSMAMARLGLTLEEQFDCPILLDGWLSSQSDPAALTIGSLCVFVGSRLGNDEPAAA